MTIPATQSGLPFCKESPAILAIKTNLQKRSASSLTKPGPVRASGGTLHPQWSQQLRVIGLGLFPAVSCRSNFAICKRPFVLGQQFQNCFATDAYEQACASRQSEGPDELGAPGPSKVILS